jgi:hypothetical protein
MGPEADVMKLKREIMEHVECDDGGEIKEFVGC